MVSFEINLYQLVKAYSSSNVFDEFTYFNQTDHLTRGVKACIRIRVFEPFIFYE